MGICGWWWTRAPEGWNNKSDLSIFGQVSCLSSRNAHLNLGGSWSDIVLIKGFLSNVRISSDSNFVNKEIIIIISIASLNSLFFNFKAQILFGMVVFTSQVLSVANSLLRVFINDKFTLLHNNIHWYFLKECRLFWVCYFHSELIFVTITNAISIKNNSLLVLLTSQRTIIGCLVCRRPFILPALGYYSLSLQLGGIICG